MSEVDNDVWPTHAHELSTREQLQEVELQYNCSCAMQESVVPTAAVGRRSHTLTHNRQPHKGSIAPDAHALHHPLSCTLNGSDARMCLQCRGGAKSKNPLNLNRNENQRECGKFRIRRVDLHHHLQTHTLRFQLRLLSRTFCGRSFASFDESWPLSWDDDSDQRPGFPSFCQTNRREKCVPVSRLSSTNSGSKT